METHLKEELVMSKHENKRVEATLVEETMDAEVREEVIETVESETTEETVTEEFVEPTVTEEFVEPTLTEPITGAVSGCKLLKIRTNPDQSAAPICTIKESSKVLIDEKESTEEFYKVCSETGVEGYCMKKYITVKK